MRLEKTVKARRARGRVVKERLKREAVSTDKVQGFHGTAPR